MRSTWWGHHVGGRQVRITAILILLCQAVAAYAGPLEDCEQAQDIEARIQGCNDRIGQFARDATAFFNRGSAYLSKGDLDRAIPDYTRVIEVDPAYSPAYYHRGIAYARRGQFDQAIADFTKALEINPGHSGALDARARAYLIAHQRMLALRDAEIAVSLAPSDGVFLDTRAHVYEALGRTQEAIADYRRVLSTSPSMQSAIDGLRRLGAPHSAPNASAGVDRGTKGNAKSHYYLPQARSSKEEEIECEGARYGDPTGSYAGYPCWAREALSRRGRR